MTTPKPDPDILETAKRIVDLVNPEDTEDHRDMIAAALQGLRNVAKEQAARADKAVQNFNVTLKRAERSEQEVAKLKRRVGELINLATERERLIAEMIAIQQVDKDSYSRGVAAGILGCEQAMERALEQARSGLSGDQVEVIESALRAFKKIGAASS